MQPSSSGNFGGLIGHVLLFNTDLSADAMTGHRLDLEALLMDKYGIV